MNATLHSTRQYSSDDEAPSFEQEYYAYSMRPQLPPDPLPEGYELQTRLLARYRRLVGIKTN